MLVFNQRSDMIGITQQCYVVGGAPRDLLMGREVKDIDFVWIGTTPEYLINKGMHQVGANFPVFLDNLGQEHALARIEKKTGKGYNGFECQFDVNVTLEQDLARRDLTINALAVKVEDWEQFVTTRDTNLVIDLFDGISHIRDGILIHINEHFGLDPIRVLRTARFSARYEFAVNTQTLDLMSKVSPELEYVPTERIWQEVYKGLQEQHPVHMFNVMAIADVFDVEVMKPYKQYDRQALKQYEGNSTLVKFCLSAIGFSYEDYNKMSVPNEYARVSNAYNQQKYKIHMYTSMSAKERLDLLYSLRSFNNTELIESVLNIFVSCVPIYGQHVKDHVLTDINRLKQLDVQEIVSQCKTGEDIKNSLYQARLTLLSNK